MEDHTAASHLYRLLSRLWLHEADVPLLQEMWSDPLKTALLANGCRLPPPTEPSLETLDSDFCQLFIGPANPLRPVQSVWLEDRLEGAATHSMRDHYLPLLTTFKLPSNLMPDHLAVQLALMAEFIDAEIEGLPRRFFQEHLSWTNPLTTAATHRSETDFYRSIITLTADFLASEASLWS